MRLPIIVAFLLACAPGHLFAQPGHLVKDIFNLPAAAGANPQKFAQVGFWTNFVPVNLAVSNGFVFFAVGEPSTGSEVWKTDGTIAGTVLVKDINPGPASSSPANLTDGGGTLFFSATRSDLGTELWKSDGTAASTVLVSDINAGITSSSPGNLTNVNAVLCFTADAPGLGRELWKSDGSTAGTHQRA